MSLPNEHKKPWSIWHERLHKTLKTKIDEVNPEFTLINDRLFKEFNKDKDNFLTNTIGMVTIASLMVMKNSK